MHRDLLSLAGWAPQPDVRRPTTRATPLPSPVESSSNPPPGSCHDGAGRLRLPSPPFLAKDLAGCQEPEFPGRGPTHDERGRDASGLEAPEERLQFLAGVEPVLLEGVVPLLEEAEHPALGLVLAEERL